jgi:hypothetical protein
MTAPALLAALTARGVLLASNGDRIQFEAPAGVLTDSDRHELKRLKPEILALLEKPCTPPARTFDAGAAYDPDQATAAAWRDFRRGKIDEATRDCRLGYADPDGEVSSHD